MTTPTTSAAQRLHAAVHRRATDLEWGVLLTRADAVALDAWIAAHCDEHGKCRADGCGAVFCDPCHGHDLCADHWPALCGDCVASGDVVPAVLTETQVRRLTSRECERLQGFPDDWTATSNGKPQSDSPRYQQMGNAVAVPVFAWVARRIREVS